MVTSAAEVLLVSYLETDIISAFSVVYFFLIWVTNYNVIIVGLLNLINGFNVSTGNNLKNILTKLNIQKNYYHCNSLIKIKTSARI